MNLNEQKEEFSLAYVHAVAACAGMQLELPRRDLGSVDGRLISDSQIIEFQAKSTAREIERDGTIRFQLPIKNYDDLRDPNTMALRILVVVQLPDDPINWLVQSDLRLCLNGHGVWHNLRGQPDRTNTSSVTVHIPASDRFDVAGLSGLMETASRLHQANGAERHDCSDA